MWFELPGSLPLAQAQQQAQQLMEQAIARARSDGLVQACELASRASAIGAVDLLQLGSQPLALLGAGLHQPRDAQVQHGREEEGEQRSDR